MDNKRPHIRFWAGLWYVHRTRDTPFAQAKGKTPLDAWMNYHCIEVEIEYRKAMLVAARGGKFNLSIIMAAWQRLRKLCE